MALLAISKPEVFSFKECLWFLNRNYDDCLHVVNGERVYRAINVDNQVIVLTVSEDKDCLIIDTGTKELDSISEEQVLQYCRQWFDLDRDIAPFYQLLTPHPELGYMAGDFRGLRLMNIPDMFEALIWSIIGQQINLTFAYKLKRALVEKYGMPVNYEGGLIHAFPQPEALAGISVEELRDMQFSRQKAAYIINAAEMFRDGKLSKQMLLKLPSAEKIAALVALKGVGQWTANYVMMKSLNDTTGIPHGDVGLLKALEDHRLILDRKDQKNIALVFNSFTGWESYLVHYLWRSLALPGPF